MHAKSKSSAARGSFRPLIFIAIGVLLLGALGFMLFVDGVEPVDTAHAEAARIATATDEQDAPEVASAADATERAATPSEVSLAAPTAEAAPALPPDATGVRGRIIGRDGKPAVGVEVSIKRSVPKNELAKFGVQPEPEDTSGIYLRVGKTDETGRFLIVDLIPSGGYSLRARGETVLLGRKDNFEVLEKTVIDLGDVALRRGALLSGVVRSEGGAPIADARVSMGWDFDSRAVKTDAQGRYQSEVVMPGRVQVRVRAKGFALREPITREILEGDVIEDFDIELVMAAPIRGRVVDDVGRPIADAYVNANREDQNNSWGWFGDASRSQADGSFSFDSLPPGKYQLSVNLQGYRGEAKPGIEAGGEPVDLKLTRVGSIEGNVIDADTQSPLVPKRLRILALQGNNKSGNRQWRPFWRGYEPEIHENGSFRISINEAGTYKVEATADGYAPGESAQFDLAANANVTGILIKLVKGSEITVVALDAATRKPIVGAQLRVMETTQANQGMTMMGSMGPNTRMDFGNASRGPLSRATTDASGRATLRSLYPGKFNVFGVADSFADVKLENIEIKAGVEPAPVELAFTQGGVIEGHVKDDRGRIETALTVFALPAAGGKRMEAITDDTGYYRITRLGAGRYRVAADLGNDEDGGFEMGMMWDGGGNEQELPIEQRFPLDVADGAVVNHDFTVTRVDPGSLSGSVAYNGMSIAGLVVNVTRYTQVGGKELDWNTNYQAKSDALGRFKFRQLKPGEYSVRVGRNWERMYEGGRVTVMSSQEANVSVDIPMGIFRVRVVDKNGNPIAGARLSLESKKSEDEGFWNSGYNATTDERGEAMFDELQAGDFRLSVSRREYRPQNVDTVTIVARRDPGPLTLTLAEGGWLAVRVEGIDRLGPGIRLRASLVNDEGNSLMASFLSRADDGRYWIDMRGNTKGTLKFVGRQQNGQSIDITSVPFLGEEGKNGEMTITVP